MATFKDAVLTKKGLALLAKAQAGQTDIHFTKAASGSGSYGPDEKLSEKEGLKEPRQETTFERITVINDIVVLIRFLISSEQESGNLQEGYYVKEVGIFAEDPNEGEILYAIATAVEDQWDYMPPYNGLMPAYITMEFYTEVCNAENVTIVCSGTFITAEEVEAELEKNRAEAEAAQAAIKAMRPKKVSQLTNDSGYKTTDNDTWRANTKTQDGYVTKGSGNPDKVWGTDADGNPGWVTPKRGDTLPEGLKSGYVRTGQDKNATVGRASTAEGSLTVPSGDYSHAEGIYSKATGDYSHTEGRQTTAGGEGSHAEGGTTQATGGYSHAEGSATTAGGEGSHAEGGRTQATDAYAHSQGYWTRAANIASDASGKCNKAMGTGGALNNKLGDAYVIGNGCSSSASSPPNELSNAFRVTYAGEVYGLSAFNSSGADYAEFIKPWADGNPDNEDRVGYLVTVKDGGLYKADEGDYIAGITSGNPSVVGNADEDYYWRYERDEFDRIVWVDVPELAPVLDGDGSPVISEDGLPVMTPTGRMIEKGTMKLAGGYDLARQKDYVERKDRPEWDYVGMVGVLAVRDDGTCIPGRFCRCGGGGIATLATERGFDTYMVIERVTDNVVKVIVR